MNLELPEPTNRKPKHKCKLTPLAAGEHGARTVQRKRFAVARRLQVQPEDGIAALRAHPNPVVGAFAIRKGHKVRRLACACMHLCTPTLLDMGQTSGEFESFCMHLRERLFVNKPESWKDRRAALLNIGQVHHQRCQPVSVALHQIHGIVEGLNPLETLQLAGKCSCPNCNQLVVHVVGSSDPQSNLKMVAFSPASIVIVRLIVTSKAVLGGRREGTNSRDEEFFEGLGVGEEGIVNVVVEDSGSDLVRPGSAALQSPAKLTV